MKVKGVAQPEATDYTAYLFLESRTDIDQKSKEESTTNAFTEIAPLLFPKMNSSREIVTMSPLLFLKEISSKKAVMNNLPYFPRRLRRGGNDKDSPSISNEDQE
uniref:Uncharacterized protein n=1 Tax=Cannabis sativa TaxID=3483 RepID=A0A803QJ66_CANSA